MSNILKNISIFVLILFAIILTSILWFFQISTTSNLVSYTSKHFTLKNILSVSKTGSTIKPYRIIGHLDNNEYSIDYANQSHKKNILDDTVSLSIKNNKYTMLKSLDFDYINNNMYYSYEYTFNIKSKYFFDTFPKAPKNFPLSSFNRILIYTKDSAAKLIFINDSTKQYCEYSIKDKYLYETINNSFSAIRTNKDTDLYNKLNDKYIPINKLNKPVYTINEYASNGELSHSSIVEKLHNFFNPSVTPKKKTIDNLYHFYDKDNVVVYYPNNVLEYTNFDLTSDVKDNFTDNYNISLNMIKNDIIVTNDFYLANISENGDSTIFYFDYIINNIPIMLSPEFQESTKMKHMIEITVENSKITRYKKISTTYSIAKDEDELSNDLINSDLPIKKTESNNKFLAYWLDNENQCMLYFIN